MPYKFGDCCIEGCDRTNVRVVRGMCTPHYDHWRKYGDPKGGFYIKGEALKFFNTVVLNYEGDDCLTWPFSRSTNGYGQVVVDGKTLNVHRHLCRIVNGEPPTPKHEAAHSCGHGDLGCITKKHLVWKTAAENQADRVLHGTSNRGERQWQAKLTQEEVRHIRRFKGDFTLAEIGELFGVSATAIGAIFRGISWGWLDDYASKTERSK